VTLKKGDESFVGEAEGMENERSRIELAARAALQALAQAEPSDRALALDGVRLIEAFDREFVFVLEGELHVIEKTADGSTRESIKPAGTFSADATNEVHVEGGGDRGVVVYFSMRGDTDRIYDFVNDDLSLRRTITIQDFDRDFQNWSSRT
jgi:hypothetical protein